MTHDHPREIARRSILRAVGGAALAGPALLAAAPSSFAASAVQPVSEEPDALESAAAGNRLPLTVVNHSGTHGNASVHVYIVGTDPRGRQVHVNRAGKAVPVALSDNGANGFTDYALPLAANGAATHLKLPRMSGRIYLSMGKKLKFKAVRDGNGQPSLQHPAGWVSSDPNFDVLHDFAEFTHNAAGMFCNTTMVDMFSIPMNLRLTGRGQHSTGTVREGGRAAVFAAMRRRAAFDRLVVDGLRVIAPGHGLDLGLFPKNYYRPYIEKVWDRYKRHSLVVKTNAGTFTGRVSGGRLTFHGPATVSFDRPTTRDILFCDGALAAPNDGVLGPVAAVLGAGFNRSTLLRTGPQPTTRPAAFYRTTLTNHYAGAIHSVVGNGKAYGFAFDDVGDFASYIQDVAPRRLQLTVTPF
ncbi:glycosyl hydrolase [Streptomyces sp. BH-SS-21]|uniref:Glycosyl hydrolase n=1 Tax=Streptomyces liliiviolaceus TaxID=2823109 RepID=A0A940XSN5_9ACTN|nr:beta-1,3-glucanase family protein [Streptomyces liliiviolaceus]MBQ0849436.1 glycosyl hydrolase [Streptomyces liliiviolaceus]